MWGGLLAEFHQLSMANLLVRRRGTKDFVASQIDDDLFEELSKSKWSETTRGYVVRSLKRDGKWVQEWLHRIVTGARGGQIVDHIDGNRFNNRRDNLRLYTYAQNTRNRRRPSRVGVSGFPGVMRSNTKGKWRARIGFDNKDRYLGTFNTAEEAFEAYKRATFQYFGEFSPFYGK